jgi:acyl-CoA synthetase (NDP forming)
VIAMTIMPQPARRISIEVAEVIRRVADRSDKPFALISDSSGGPREPGVAAALEGTGIAYLSGLRNGLTAIARWLQACPPSPEPAAPTQAFLDQCRAFAERRAELDEPERFQFLSSIGVPMSSSQAVSSAAAAARAADRLGAPVVLNGSAPDVLHKSEHGLVALGLKSAAEVSAAYDALSAQLKRASHSPRAQVVMQPQAEPGVEIIVGVRNHPGFGSLLVVGLGGTFVELLKETSVRLGPVDERTARAMLDEIRAGAMLRGFRGSGPFDIDAAASAIAAVSRFGAATIDRLAALEINPLIVHPAGQGAVGVDALFEQALVGAAKNQAS